MSIAPACIKPTSMDHWAGRDFLALASGLAQDHGIRLEVGGDKWGYFPEGHLIMVPSDFGSLSLEEALGIVAHEVGHSAISRYHRFSRTFQSEAGWLNLLNCLEDRRVEHWMEYRYPGTRRWFAILLEARHSEAPQSFKSRFMTFAQACLDGVMPEKASDEVCEAFALQKNARDAYIANIPMQEAELSSLSRAQTDAYNSRVVPRLVKRETIPNHWEQTVQMSALAALEIAEAEIFSSAWSLWEKDVDVIAHGLYKNPGRIQQGVIALSRDNHRSVFLLVDALLSQSLLSRPDSNDPNIEVLAKRLYERYLEIITRPKVESLSHRTATEVKGMDYSPKTAPHFAAKPYNSSEPQLKRYHEIVSEISDQIGAFRRALDENILQTRPGWSIGCYATGGKVSLPAVMSGESDPRRRDRIWRRRVIPQKKSLAVSILVDLSGSMRGSKIEYATRGIILLTETLRLLGFPFAVTGFQDETIPFITFDQPITECALATLTDMPLETCDRRPDGHNCHEFNDDGPCLAETASTLQAMHADCRWLIVISDGEPAGRRSDGHDLHNAIRDINAMRPPVTLVGIGLGSGTDHVKSFYPLSESNVDVEHLSAVLGDLLRQAISGTRIKHP